MRLWLLVLAGSVYSLPEPAWEVTSAFTLADGEILSFSDGFQPTEELRPALEPALTACPFRIVPVSDRAVPQKTVTILAAVKPATSMTLFSAKILEDLPAPHIYSEGYSERFTSPV